MSKFELISPQEKVGRGILPYVTFPIINKCNLHCLYCGAAGEMTLSEDDVFQVEKLQEWVDAAEKLGVQKFRITGGEPLLHPDFRKIIFEVMKNAREVLINTNGTLLMQYKDKWIDSPSNCKYVVNFHASKEETYDKITGTKGNYQVLKQGIELLASEQLLHRLNIVICQENYNQLFDVIDYCRSVGTDLKIQDVVSVPWAFNEWKTIYYDTSEIEEELEKKASYVKDHKYARGFGTPTKIYTIDGVNITFKSIRNGSHYNLDNLCNNCKYYPCHEGVYDLFVFPDDKACVCNWTHIGNASGNTLEEKLADLIPKFQNTQYCPAEINKLSGMTL